MNDLPAFTDLYLRPYGEGVLMPFVPDVGRDLAARTNQRNADAVLRHYRERDTSGAEQSFEHVRRTAFGSRLAGGLTSMVLLTAAAGKGVHDLVEHEDSNMILYTTITLLVTHGISFLYKEIKNRINRS